MKDVDCCGQVALTAWYGLLCAAEYTMTADAYVVVGFGHRISISGRKPGMFDQSWIATRGWEAEW